MKQLVRANRVLLGYLLTGVVVALVLVASFGLAGMAPRPLWFVALALAVAFGAIAIRLSFTELRETAWPSRYDDRSAALFRRADDSRAQFLATWVQESGRERRAGDGEGSASFTRRLRPLLLELATDRLVSRHGVDPALEPDRARAITGDELWHLINGTTGTTSTSSRTSGAGPGTASLAELERAVRTIENL